MTKSILTKSISAVIIILTLVGCAGEIKYQVNKNGAEIKLFVNGDADGYTENSTSTGTWEWVAEPDSVIKVYLTPVSTTLEAITEEMTFVLTPNADKTDFTVTPVK